MKQVVIIHGGNSFNSYDRYIEHLATSQLDYGRLKYQQKWNPWIAQQLPGVDVLLPTFPNSSNAVYVEWKLYFDKIIPFLGEDVQLVGHSLGAMFLAKYLHEHILPSRVRRVILIAGAYADEQSGDLGTFKITQPVTSITATTDEVRLLHSTDDPVVPFAELAHFQADIPDAITHTFTDRQHFNQPTFPELLDLLQSQYRIHTAKRELS